MTVGDNMQISSVAVVSKCVGSIIFLEKEMFVSSFFLSFVSSHGRSSLLADDGRRCVSVMPKAPTTFEEVLRGAVRTNATVH